MILYVIIDLWHFYVAEAGQGNEQATKNLGLYINHSNKDLSTKKSKLT